jgi:hypothetical protein
MVFCRCGSDSVFGSESLIFESPIMRVDPLINSVAERKVLIPFPAPVFKSFGSGFGLYLVNFFILK